MRVLMVFRQVRNQGNLVLCKAERLFILQRRQEYVKNFVIFLFLFFYKDRKSVV